MLQRWSFHRRKAEFTELTCRADNQFARSQGSGVTVEMLPEDNRGLALLRYSQAKPRLYR
jgi:hypothetical protein